MSNRINLDDPNYNQNRVTIQDNKAKAVWIVLVAIASIVIITVFVLHGGEKTGSTSNPNRTSEYCSYYGGDTKVFPASHNNNCIPDADGYFLVGFGHHHHK